MCYRRQIYNNHSIRKAGWWTKLSVFIAFSRKIKAIWNSPRKRNSKWIDWKNKQTLNTFHLVCDVNGNILSKNLLNRTASTLSKILFGEAKLLLIWNDFSNVDSMYFECFNVSFHFSHFSPSFNTQKSITQNKQETVRIHQTRPCLPAML